MLNRSMEVGTEPMNRPVSRRGRDKITVLYGVEFVRTRRWLILRLISLQRLSRPDY